MPTQKKFRDSIHAKGTEITVLSTGDANDYISLTDIARYKSDAPDDVIKNWMRNRDTIEFLGLWEQLNNPDFKPVEFDGFRVQGWNLNRTLAKINYRVHTDAIKDMLIPPDVTPQRQSYTYANEADVLNVALFGITAKEWRQAHPDSKGNIRDEASLQQLIVLANMESINAELIRQGVPQSERLLRLNASAKQMMQSLTNDHRIEAFKEYGTLPHESE